MRMISMALTLAVSAGDGPRGCDWAGAVREPMVVGQCGLIHPRSRGYTVSTQYSLDVPDTDTAKARASHRASVVLGPLRCFLWRTATRAITCCGHVELESKRLHCCADYQHRLPGCELSCARHLLSLANALSRKTQDR